MKKKAAVIVFPGSNCDKEAREVLLHAGFNADLIWHEESLPRDIHLCFIPGGFSYGDYLRSGAIASRKSIITEVCEFGKRGGFIIGVCNGFQILTEAKILPGALLKNESGNFVSREVTLKTVNCSLLFTKDLKNEITLQVAHGDGRYVADKTTLDMLRRQNRIVFEYKENFNGSMESIAGIVGGENYNILGMMPHPERTLLNPEAISIFFNLANDAS